MGILENAAEIDRLYIVHDEAEQVERKNNEAASAARNVVDHATQRIEMLFDGMACSIPSTVDEALGLAVLLRSMTDSSVFLEHDGPTRERADRIVNNIIVGLNRLSSADTLPAWIEDHVRAAAIDPDLRMREDQADSSHPSQQRGTVQ